MYTPIKKPGRLRDAGVEDSIVRNIARDEISAKAVLSPPEAMSNYEIMHMLSANRAMHTVLNVLDMVVCELGTPTAYLTTDPSSGSLIKTIPPPPISKIVKNFTDISEAATADYGACVVGADGSTNLLTIPELQKCTKTSFPSTALAVTAYVTPKSGSPISPTTYTNFIHQYKLDKLANPQERHLRVGVDEGVTGKKGRHRGEVGSMNKLVNTGMTKAVRAIVGAIESTNRCRVTSLTTHFLVDSSDNAWFLKTTVCEIAREPSDAKSKVKDKEEKQRKR